MQLCCRDQSKLFVLLVFQLRHEDDHDRGDDLLEDRVQEGEAHGLGEEDHDQDVEDLHDLDEELLLLQVDDVLGVHIMDDGVQEDPFLFLVLTMVDMHTLKMDFKHLSSL